MTATGGEVERARAAYAAGAWADAAEAFRAADAERSLDGDDLEQLAFASWLLGDVPGTCAARERAFELHLGADRPERAVRSAFWLGLMLLFEGEEARGGGWLARAAATVEEHGVDTVERGYLLIPAGIQALRQGRTEAATDLFEQAAALARAFGDADLEAMSTLGRGQAALAAGQVAAGVVLLDQAMVVVTSPGAAPVLPGIVHCAVIEGCMDVGDLGRAEEWTRSLAAWCERNPEMASIEGQCLVRRAELDHLHGDWPRARELALDAHRRFEAAQHPAIGMCWYQRGEMHRLAGEVAQAEEAYREAARHGDEPQPGLALLRLQTGDVQRAAAASRRFTGEARGGLTRVRSLQAHVEIMLAVDDLDAARAAAGGLRALADDHAVPMLRAAAADAEGAVALAEGAPARADRVLRAALRAWLELGAVLEAARTRLLLGRACQAVGDLDSAELEWETARQVFVDLGAAPCLALLDALVAEAAGAGTVDRSDASGLTGRELEVLEQLATGATNREIAEELVISEKTVARHLSNIFTKLGVSTRSAATAYAYEHELV